jgi:hypothetical protein
MADLKISQLSAFTETDVVSGDVLPLADVSAQETKKIAASDLVKAGARLSDSPITFGDDVVVTGDLTVNGTTTTIDTQNLTVEDKNIEIGKVTTPTDVTADGGGITLKGTTDKTLNWVNATDSWTSSENIDLAAGKDVKIAGTKVIDATSLGSGVVSSSLTSVGTVTTGTWSASTIATNKGGTGQTTYTNGQLLIGKTDGTLAKATLTASTGVTITNGDGTITISATGSGGTVTSVTASSPLASTGGNTPDISIQDGTTTQKGAVQLEDSTSSTSTTKAATPNSVKTAYDLANAALPKAGGTVTGNLEIGTAGSLMFEGATADGFETTLAVVNPTADRTITLPDVTGTVVTTGDTGTVTSTMIADGTIVDGDVNASAAISGSKIQAATTTNAGAVQLTDSTSSTSTTTAATPNSVKSAYDLANAALPKAGGAMTGDITLNAQSDLRFADSDSSNWVAFQAPATVSSNVTWTLPAADGTNGQFLQTNGTGTLSWAAATSVPTTNITHLTTGTSATYTPTSGTRSIYVEVIGAGGGGGGVDGQGAGTNALSASGAGGGYAAILITNMSQTFTYTIGAGGSGGAAGNNSGSAGGTSSFIGSTTGTISATGGSGGDGDNGNNTFPKITQGVAGGSGSGGTVNYAGSWSSNAVSTAIGSLDRSTAGAAPTIGGGAIGPNAATGTNGTNYGEGGTGTSVSAAGANYAGGDGASGVIRITEFF